MIVEVDTARLRLRQWREPDRAPFAALNADPAVMEFFLSPLSRESSDASVEVGWRLVRPAWGHGFATEAAREALRVGFGEVGLDEVVSFTSEGNGRSRSVMERLGMTHDPAEDFDHPALPTGSPSSL